MYVLLLVVGIWTSVSLQKQVQFSPQRRLNVMDEILVLLKTTAVDCKSLGLQARSFIWSGLKCHSRLLQYAASLALGEGEKLLGRRAVSAAGPA